MEYIIRKREREDCKSVAHVVTIAWNETYQGIVPDWFLKRLYDTEEERKEKSYNKFSEEDNNYLVLEVDGEIVGFTYYGQARDQEYNGCGEIYALYILKKYHGNGYGRLLVNEAVKKLKELGYDKMLIACLKGNPTNEFYKHIGGIYVKDGLFTGKNNELNLEENIYYFDKI